MKIQPIQYGLYNGVTHKIFHVPLLHVNLANCLQLTDFLNKQDDDIFTDKMSTLLESIKGIS